MQTIAGFDVFPLRFDDDGAPESRQELDALLVGAAAATDAIVIAHGFRNDAADATSLYTSFLTTLRANLKRPEFHDMAGRRFVVAGVYWPSKAFRETFGEAGDARELRDPRGEMSHLRDRLEAMKAQDATPAQRPKLDAAIALLPTLDRSARAQDEFVALVLSLLEHSTLDKTEGLQEIRERAGSELLQRLSPPAEAGHTRDLSHVLGSIAGGVGQFLNLTTWYIMKDRSGTVGTKGVTDAVRALHGRHPAIRLHLVGHSLGARLMASCAKALSAAPALPVDSLVLLEGAFSHFGFSPDNGHGTPGFFRDVVARRIVKGPFVSTFSAEDTVVGGAYAVMSRLAGDNTREIGDASDQFGGIGRNGALKTPEAASEALHKPGAGYAYKTGVINNLNGSGGLITNHSDVTNEAVTYAFASALART